MYLSYLHSSTVVAMRPTEVRGNPKRSRRKDVCDLDFTQGHLVGT